MSHHFRNIFSFASNVNNLPIVTLSSSDNYVVSDCSLGTVTNTTYTNCNQEYDDYEIRITSIPGPTGPIGPVGGAITQDLMPNGVINLGTTGQRFNHIYVNELFATNN